MEAATLHPISPQRGSDLLLTHCLALAESREPALVRLAALIGRDLAERLVSALAGSQPPRFGGLGA